MVIVFLLPIALVVFFSFNVFSRYSTVTGPTSPTPIYKLLYPWKYLEPTSRICRFCAYANPPVFLECIGPAHPADKDNSKGLILPALITRDVRIWGIRVLLGFVLLAALWLNSSIALYTVLAVIAFWIISPMVVPRQGGLITFLVVGITLFVIIGRLHLFPYTLVQHWFVHRLSLPKIHVGFLELRLNQGHVTNGTIFLIALGVVTTLIGIFLSTLSHYSYREPKFSGPFVVFAFGIFVSAFLLFALSSFLLVPGVTLLFIDVMVLSFGWLLTAFVERAIEQGIKNVVITRTTPYLGTFNGFAAAKFPPRPMPNADFLVQMSYSITIAAVYMINGILSIASTIVSILLQIGNTLIGIFHWIMEFLIQTLRALLREITTTPPILLHLSTIGFRVTLYAPLLLFFSLLAIAASANAGLAYLT